MMISSPQPSHLVLFDSRGDVRGRRGPECATIPVSLVAVTALLMLLCAGPAAPITVALAAPTTAFSSPIANNGPNPSTQYTAEYAALCDAATILSYTTAVTACAGLGSGWALATVPSAAAQTDIVALSTNVMWLAGSDVTVEGEWRWTAGRLTNALFYKGQYDAVAACSIAPCSCEAGAYCHWRLSPAEPNDSAGSKDYMALAPSSGWNDVTASAASIVCAACERSLCTLALDCNAANTLSVNTSKYFVFGEPCGCVCKDGFTGPRCDSPIVPVNTGAYSAEFGVTCNAATIFSYATAVTACAGLGSGWALATVPSAAAQTDIANISSDHMWLAGSDAAIEGEWRWTAGRLTNTLFYKGQYAGAACSIAPCSCEAGAYCHWNAASEPNNSAGDEDYMMLISSVVSPSRQWNDLPASGTVTCAACERSLCTLALDCNAVNTLSVNTSKYFVFGEPCGCVCKDGFSGPRCDDAAPSVSVNGAYVSQFMGECASQPLSWTEAAGRCSARGSGWALATINSAAAQTAVAALLPGFATWIGGHDLAANDVFVWQFGRLQGQTFFTGRKVPSTTTCATGPCASPAGMFNNFNAFQPDDTGGLESYIMMVAAGKMWNDAPHVYSTTRCYACERSPCLDVTVASAVVAALVAAGGSTSSLKFSAYYPNCTGTVSPSVSQTAATSLSVADSFTSSPALSTSRSRAISASFSSFYTRSTSYRPSSTNQQTVSAPRTASLRVPKTATVALPPPSTTAAATTSIATTTPSATTATDTTSATTTAPTTASAATTPASTPETSTTTTSVSESSGTTAAPSSTSTTESTEITTTSTEVQNTSAPVATSSAANCSAKPASDEMVASSETTLVLFPSVEGSTTSNYGGSGYVLSFPLPSSTPLAIAATANTPFNLVWNVTSGGTHGEEALAQTLRNHVVMFVQCTAPPSESQAAAASLLVRCSIPPFSVPEATVGAAPVRVTITAAVSDTMLLHESACPASAPTTLLLVATIIVAPPTAGGDTTATATVLRIALAASGAATTAFAILVEPWALEPLLLVGVLDGPCAGLAGLQTMARFAVYSLNPFVPLTTSPSAGGLLLVLLVGVVTVANAAVAYVRTPTLQTTAADDADADQGLSLPPRWRRSCGKALFPRVAFSVAVAAVPGVSWALSTTIRDHATASSSSSQSLLFIVLGSVCVVLVPAVGALVVFRAAPATFLAADCHHPLLHTQPDASAVRRWARRLVTPVGSFVQAAASTSGAAADDHNPNPSAALLAVPRSSSATHQNHRRADTQPAPTNNTATTLITSRPQSMPQALNLRGVTAGPRGGSQLFVGSALLSVAVFAITAAPPLSGRCAARHYIAAAVLLLSAVLVAAVRPHRTPLATILTAALLTLIGLCAALVGAAAAASEHRPQSETSHYATAVFALALVAILVSVVRTAHALWLWRAYDRQPRHTASRPEEDTKEMNLMITTN